MTVLEAVSAYVPPTALPIESICGPDGLPEAQARVFRRFYGLDTVRWDPGATHAEILMQAIRKLPALRGREHLVRHVIAARTLQAVVPEPINVVRQVCEQAGLSHANSFALTQHACSPPTVTTTPWPWCSRARRRSRPPRSSSPAPR